MTRYLLAFMVCCGVVLYQTHNGLTVFGDGEFYLSAAQHHERGEEMRNPTHDQHDPFLYPSGGIYATWAPLYPWLLARLHQSGMSYNGAGRIINALAMGISAACLLYLLADCLWWIQALSVVLFMAHPGMVFSYTHQLTEPLSICLMLVSLALLWRWDASRHFPS